jgi:glycine hydroxymethyltransferase
MGAIRLGTNEMVRWGMTPSDMAFVGDAVVRSLRGDDPAAIAADVSVFRRRFDRVHFCR